MLYVQQLKDKKHIFKGPFNNFANILPQLSILQHIGETGWKERGVGHEPDMRLSGLLSLKPLPSLNKDENIVWRMRRKREAMSALSIGT